MLVLVLWLWLLLLLWLLFLLVVSLTGCCYCFDGDSSHFLEFAPRVAKKSLNVPNLCSVTFKKHVYSLYSTRCFSFLESLKC